MVALIDQYEARIDPHMRDARPGEDWSAYKARKFKKTYEKRKRLTT